MDEDSKWIPKRVKRQLETESVGNVITTNLSKKKKAETVLIGDSDSESDKCDKNDDCIDKENSDQDINNLTSKYSSNLIEEPKNEVSMNGKEKSTETSNKQKPITNWLAKFVVSTSPKKTETTSSQIPLKKTDKSDSSDSKEKCGIVDNNNNNNNKKRSGILSALLSDDFSEDKDVSEYKLDNSPHKKFRLPGSVKKEEISEVLILNEEPLVKVPGTINSKLRDYQRDGVKFLYGLYKEKKGGILADDMGLGKTIQTIAFVCAILNTGGKEDVNFFTTNNNNSNKETAPVLIVAPASVLQQWEREIGKWSRLKTEIYQGKKRELIVRTIKRINVVLTSYETFRMSSDVLNKINWNALIFDEVHKIKNNNSKITKCVREISQPCKYGLSGSIMQNTFDELWCLLDFISPNYLDTLQNFRSNYIAPIKNGQRFDATYSQIARGRLCSKRLALKIGKIVLRRDKTLIKDSLPTKQDNIIFCKPTDIQLEIYKRVLNSNEYQILQKLGELCDCGSEKTRADCCYQNEYNSNKETKKQMLSAITRLQKIANHPALLIPQNNGKNIEKYKRDLEFEQLAFGEKFEEIKEWIKQGKDEIICGKLKVLKSLLPVWRKKGNKVLLFSMSTKNLDLLELFLKKDKYSYCRLDGTIPAQQRQKIVDVYNNTPSKFIFLISTKAGGLGLNLVSANTVVVFDPNWNASFDLQAQDRAFRIGQKRDVNVFRLITSGTIEEVIYNRQIYKQQLSRIGTEGKYERRLYNGVQGIKGQEGELFGAANLFKLVDDSSSITQNIVNRAMKLEQDYYIQESQLNENNENNKDIENAQTTTTTTTTTGEENDMATIFNSNNKEDEEFKNIGIDLNNNGNDDEIIKELLKKAGVVYSHLNTDVVGEAEFEKKISEKATKEYETQLKEEQFKQDIAYQNYITQQQTYNNIHLQQILQQRIVQQQQQQQIKEQIIYKYSTNSTTAINNSNNNSPRKVLSTPILINNNNNNNINNNTINGGKTTNIPTFTTTTSINQFRSIYNSPINNNVTVNNITSNTSNSVSIKKNTSQVIEIKDD